MKLSIILIFMVLTGCAALQNWEESSENKSLPWVAPDKRVIELFNRKECVMCTSGRTLQYQWADHLGGHIGEPQKFNREIKQFLGKTKLGKSWPSTRGSVWGENGPRIIAPYKFYLVAVKPSIVIMAYDESSRYIMYRDKGWAIGTPEKGEIFDRLVTNRIYPQTELPAYNELMWFSPDLQLEPTPLDTSLSIISINIGSEGLIIEQKNMQWKTSRIEI